MMMGLEITSIDGLEGGGPFPLFPPIYLSLCKRGIHLGLCYLPLNAALPLSLPGTEFRFNMHYRLYDIPKQSKILDLKRYKSGPRFPDHAPVTVLASR
jgi:hypothetical protein